MLSYLIKILLLQYLYTCLNVNGVENCLLIQCDYSRSNYNQTVIFQANNYDANNGLLDIALAKVQEPSGSVEYICSKHNNNFFVREHYDMDH